MLSGDAVIVRGQPKGGPPPERQINFSNVIAPRQARRATAKYDCNIFYCFWILKGFAQLLLVICIVKSILFNMLRLW